MALRNLDVALRNLDVAPEVGEKGRLKVGEKTASHLTPLHAPVYNLAHIPCTNRTCKLLQLIANSRILEILCLRRLK